MHCLLIEDQPVFLQGIELCLKRRLPASRFTFSKYVPSRLVETQLEEAEFCIWGLNETNHYLWPDIQRAAQRRRLPVVVLSGVSGLQWARRCMEAGFAGLVYKDLPEDFSPEAVEAVLAEQRYIGSWYARNLLLSTLPPPYAERLTTLNRPWQITLGDAHFLRLLCQDLSTQEIADQLQVQVSTVYRRQRALRQKLNLDSVAKLLPWAYLHLADFV